MEQNVTLAEQTRKLVDQAFGKALAAAIISELPIGSIIAIFLGNAAGKQVAQARAEAEEQGTTAGGKCTAANVLSKVGKFAGIGYTIFWGVYGIYWLIYFVFIMLMIATTGGF